MRKAAASTGVCGLYSSHAGKAAAPAVAALKEKNLKLNWYANLIEKVWVDMEKVLKQREGQKERMVREEKE